MNRTLIAIWAVIVGSILAIVALAWLWNHQRETDARLNFAALLEQQLTPYNREISEIFRDYDRQIQRALEGFDPRSRSSLMELQRHPLASLVIVVSDDGAQAKLLYPAASGIELADRSLIADAVAWIRDSNFTQRSRTSSTQNQSVQQQESQQQQAQQPLQQESKEQALQQQAPPQSQQQSQEQSQEQSQQLSVSRAPSAGARTSSKMNFLPFSRRATSDSEPVQLGNANSAASTSQSHWTTWYHGRGLVLGYWTGSLHNTVTMILVPRGRWLADVVAALPDNQEARDDALIQLVDVEGTVITQWGNVSLVGDSAHCPIKDAEVSIDDPLEGWRLRLTLAPEARRLATGQTMRWVSVMAALGSSATLVLLGVLITLNLNRQLRLAAEQVSFVNQVSHELRTPLTNIRMYTDLALQGLETHPDAGLEPEIERLSIIQQESSRLGRLIENVLSFARMGRSDRSLQVQEVVDLDAVIDQVVATFAPPLDELGIQVARERGVHQSVSVNLEIVEQILVNLISNAIKYASAGKMLRLQSQLSGADLFIRVIDAGPGIPKRLRRRVFEPFFRLSNRLEDPAGTGIGLSIARELARQHGGDCVLENTQVGCSFLVRLRTEHRASGHG